MSYHIEPIPKGVLGSSSKIMEELKELQDAERQGCKIMTLVELSDLIGAVDHYLVKNFPDMELRDLYIMAKITERAFKSGARS